MESNPFKIGDTVYALISNRPFKATIKEIYEVKNGIRYLLYYKTPTYSNVTKKYSHDLFRTKEELLKSIEKDLL